jgi:hypothetical protein
MNHAKQLGFLLMPALLAPALCAQGPSQEELQEKYEDKIAEDWVEHGGWILDLDKAKEIAKKENKAIFVYFSRSYAP